MDAPGQRRGREKHLAIAAFGALAVALSGAATGSMIGDTGMISRSDHAYDLPENTVAHADNARSTYVAKSRRIDGETVHRGELRYVGRDQPSFFDEDYASVTIEYIAVDGLTSAPEYADGAATPSTIERAQDVAQAARSQSARAPRITVVRGTESSVEAIAPDKVSDAEAKPQAAASIPAADSSQVLSDSARAASGG